MKKKIISKTDTVALRACARELHLALTGNHIDANHPNTLCQVELRVRNIATAKTPLEQRTAMLQLKRTYESYLNPTPPVTVSPDMDKARAVLQEYKMMPTP